MQNHPALSEKLILKQKLLKTILSILSSFIVHLSFLYFFLVFLVSCT